MLSQFLTSYSLKGDIIARTKEYGNLPILKIEILPYFKEERMKIEYNNSILTCDFSKAFFHDKKDYKLKIIIGVNEFENPIVIEDLNSDSVNEIEIKDIIDDNYTIELYYYSYYSGIRNKDTKISLKNDVIMFGDIVKARFNAKKQIIFDKCRISEGNKKIKNNIITNIKYLYDDGENRVYEGNLKTPYTKNSKIIFYADHPDMIRKVFFVSKSAIENKKEANFDINKNSIVNDNNTGIGIYHMSSIYLKK